MALGTLRVTLGTLRVALGTLGTPGVALSPLSPLSPVVFGEHSLLVTVSGQKLFVVKRHHHVQEPVAV
uniref:Ragulator complex protein LAMTOR4 n=1 Tax=Cyanoderma ruficeps TaxID=181631 RepID=A0A8C3R0Q4_9PASS